MKKHLIPILAGIAIVTASAVFLLRSAPQAPKLTFKTLDNQSMSLGQLKGKVVLVNFWATSCSGCMAEMPDLIRIQQRFGKEGYQTVAIAMAYDQRSYIDTYQQKTQMPFLISHDTENRAADAFGGVTLTPTTFLIGKNGEILQKYIGTPDMEELQSRIQTALRS